MAIWLTCCVPDVIDVICLLDIIARKIMKPKPAAVQAAAADDDNDV